MKNTKARDNSGDDWKTPDWFYNKLNEKYHFDFDPCPYQAGFDGLAPAGVACKNLGRDFIGIELNPEYFRIAEERIEKA